MLAFLGRIFGSALVGWLTNLFGRRQRDKLVVKAADAKRAEDALAKNKKDAADAAKADADVRALSDDDLDERLRRYARKRKP